MRERGCEIWRANESGRRHKFGFSAFASILRGALQMPRAALTLKQADIRGARFSAFKPLCALRYGYTFREAHRRRRDFT